MDKKMTIGDKLFIFFVRIFMPKTMKELERLRGEYKKVNNAIREKQAELDTSERKIRKLEREMKKQHNRPYHF